MVEKKTEWVKMKPAEVEKLVLDLHKEGNTPAKIGLILRDKHGIPKAKLVGKKISQIIIANKETPVTEKVTFGKKISTLEAHIVKHKHDYSAKKSLSKGLWTIKKLK